MNLDEVIAAATPPPEQGDCKTPPIRALLVEDNVGFAYFIRDVLMRKNKGRYALRAAETLADGLAVLGREEVDVLLLDLGLPDSVRIETFQTAHAASPETAIIILTVLNDDDVAMEAMRSGAQDYLVKDQITEELLLRSIRYALERSRIQKALHHLSGRLLELRDEERRRVARALHDSTAQALAALSLNLSALHSRCATLPADLMPLLEESMELAGVCSQEIRTMSYLLHPPLLDELGLAGAVREYADGFAARSGIRVDLELPPDLGRLGKEVETTLFRVIQECLTNIHRHSGSPTASVRIALSEREIELTVQDAGTGISPEAASLKSDSGVTPGVGIAGVRERLRQLGGRLHIESDAAGTTVAALLPVRR